jgi:septin family protein
MIKCPADFVTINNYLMKNNLQELVSATEALEIVKTKPTSIDN